MFFYRASTPLSVTKNGSVILSPDSRESIGTQRITSIFKQALIIYPFTSVNRKFNQFCLRTFDKTIYLIHRKYVQFLISQYYRFAFKVLSCTVL